jgi:hypothetical protein
MSKHIANHEECYAGTGKPSDSSVILYLPIFHHKHEILNSLFKVAVPNIDYITSNASLNVSRPIMRSFYNATIRMLAWNIYSSYFINSRALTYYSDTIAKQLKAAYHQGSQSSSTLIWNADRSARRSLRDLLC